MPGVTINTLMSATGASASDAGKYLSYINSAMSKYDINTAARQLAFLSQVGQESDHLRTMEEYASGADYEFRSDLGNTVEGDGVKYKGRGALQVTGRANYNSVSKALGIDAINNPSLLSQPQYAFLTAAWWWYNHGLNQIADTMNISKPLSDPQNTAAFDKITKVINGGYNGLVQRENNWQAGEAAFLRFAKQNPVTVTLGFLTFGLIVTATGYYLINKHKIVQSEIVSLA